MGEKEKRLQSLSLLSKNKIMLNEVTKYTWWKYLPEDVGELIKESLLLVAKVPSWSEKFHDYSFVVFPAAKAYEGYLKKLFLDKGFISEADYFGRRFRVGKSLNPELDKEIRGESVYDKIVAFCGEASLADELWDTWIKCRNLVFHWFPNEKNAVSFSEAEERVKMIILAIGHSNSYLGINVSK